MKNCLFWKERIVCEGKKSKEIIKFKDFYFLFTTKRKKEKKYSLLGIFDVVLKLMVK